MKQLGLKKGLMVFMFATMSVGVVGCTSSNKKESKIIYSETEKNILNKGMDNQPESSYWFPEDLLVWDVNQDEDAKFNTSKIPLAKRVDKSELVKSNDSQNEEMKIVALSIMNSSTSGNAPRGINNFDANVFSYWQYIDQLVYWGGSSGEGIIVPPSPDVIDAAHKNGVPVLGNIFFPQTAHGGKIEWLDTFLEKDTKGEFPIVDKLIEVANIYGFDGWFINQETDTEVTSFDEAKEGLEKNDEKEQSGGLNKQHAILMKELITEFKIKSNDKLEIMWYDSMTSEGKMDWQNAFTDDNKEFMVDAQMNPLSDSMFLNFWWNTEKLAKEELLKHSKEKAEETKINPYDLYAGIDVQEEGYMTPVDWSLFLDKQGKPYTSLGLYVPSWTYATSNSPDEFQEKENMFWVNSIGDSRQSELPTENAWPGMSAFAMEQTAITELPFITNFNLGNGYNYFIDGQKVSSMEWNNRSLQDIMPTYRWQFDHGEGNNLDVTMDYSDAYNGGNAIKLRGNMVKTNESLMKLYETQVSFDKNTVVKTIAKANVETELDLVLGYEDGQTEIFKGDKNIGEDWTTVTYDVKKAINKKVTSIAYQITSKKDVDVFELKLGQLSIDSAKTSDQATMSGLAVEDVIFDEEESNFAGIRLIWDESESLTTNSYEIYRVNEDKSRSFLGATNSNNFYVNALERQEGVTETKIEVVPLNGFKERGQASDMVSIEWPDNTVPKADFSASKTLIAPGDSVTFKNRSSANTENISWEFEGGNIKESQEDEVNITYDKAGTYSVILTAKNESGETKREVEKFITVDEKVKGELNLLSKNAATEASSFVNDGEAPKFAVDEKLDTKWCATGNAPHEITLDLGDIKTISEVQMRHAEAGGEGPDMNTKAYSIEVSEDGKEFTQIVRVINNEHGETIDTFPVVNARYVRMITDKPTQGADSAARIYGISVYGLK